MTRHRHDTPDEGSVTLPEMEAVADVPATRPETPASKARKSTGQTLPPSQRWVSVLAHTLLDLAVIGAVLALVLWAHLDVTVGVGIIAVVSGAWLKGQITRGGHPPVSSAVMTVASGVAELFRRKMGG